jgi:hypothetical protein
MEVQACIEIDLPRRQSQSDRPKVREPIFGSGAVPLLAQLLAIAMALGIFFLFAALGHWFAGHARPMISELMFGEPARSQHFNWPSGK